MNSSLARSVVVIAAVRPGVFAMSSASPKRGPFDDDDDDDVRPIGDPDDDDDDDDGEDDEDDEDDDEEPMQLSALL